MNMTLKTTPNPNFKERTKNIFSKTQHQSDQNETTSETRTVQKEAPRHGCQQTHLLDLNPLKSSVVDDRVIIKILNQDFWSQNQC